MTTGDVQSQCTLLELNGIAERASYTCRPKEASSADLPHNQHTEDYQPSFSQHIARSPTHFSPIHSPYVSQQSDRGQDIPEFQDTYKECSTQNYMPQSSQSGVMTQRTDYSRTDVNSVPVHEPFHDDVKQEPANEMDVGGMLPALSLAFLTLQEKHSVNSSPERVDAARRSTRSGRPLVEPSINHESSNETKATFDGHRQKVTRVCKAPRKRKGPGEKQERPKVPKLTKCLSELTKDYHHLPIRNMDTWVQRPPEVRWAEVDKRGGYVTRPMNSFMLYRSAYAERTKLWCLQNNHQVVSSVSGESWPLEPQHIREKYNELAKVERVNHQAAHPGYKFSPSKAQGGRKRKNFKREGDSESISDLDSLADAPGSGSKSKNARTVTAQGDLRNSLGYLSLSLDSTDGGAHRSSFVHNNPGRTPPACMGTATMNGQYYQTTIRPNSVTSIPNLMPSTVIEDITIRKTKVPGGPVHARNMQSAMNCEMHMYDNSPPVGHEDISKVDPLLLNNEDHGHAYNVRYHDCLHQQVGEDSSIGIGTFGIDPLFSSASDDHVSGDDYRESIHASEHSGRFLLDAGADIQKLPGYDISMQDFLDTEEPWAVSEDAPSKEDDNRLCYDEWLQ